MELALAVGFVLLAGWQAGSAMIEYRAGDMRFAGLHGALALWSGLQCGLATGTVYS